MTPLDTIVEKQRTVAENVETTLGSGKSDADTVDNRKKPNAVIVVASYERQKDHGILFSLVRIHSNDFEPITIDNSGVSISALR